MQVTLRRGLFLFSFLYLLSLSIGISLASTVEGGDDPGKSENPQELQDMDEPQSKSDSTDVHEARQSSSTQHYELEPEFGTLNPESEDVDVTDVEPVSPDRSTNDTYYDNDDDESSQSIMSFNFLYFLLQKFKFSNSLGY